MENKILRILQYPLWIQLSIKHVFPCVYGRQYRSLVLPLQVSVAFGLVESENLIAKSHFETSVSNLIDTINAFL